MRYEKITIADLKARIAEIEDILTWPETKANAESEAAIKGDLKELKEALEAKENKMIKVAIFTNEETGKVEARDLNGKVHQSNKRLSDLKTALRKKGGYEIVEDLFATVEDFDMSGEPEKPAKKEKIKKEIKEALKDKEVKGSVATEKAPKTDKVPAKKGNTYEDRKQYIITNFDDADLYSKSPKIAKFCKKFDLTLTKAGRNLTFEKTLDKMTQEGIVDYVATSGKYKKLEWYYTEAHNAAMNPDDEL